MISQKTKRRVKRITGSFLALIFSALLCVGLLPEKAYAEGGILDDSNWQLIFDIDTVGLVQSICITDYYIISIENVADSRDVHDIVTAYYRYDFDENGNPVERYSVAKRNDLEEWEHGNGMCYNPVTNEIYVALYTNTFPENKGCLYVMDPDTLQKKGTIKVADNYNILGIVYNNLADQYVIQTNQDAAYSVKILDSSFNLVADLGPEDPSPGTNFQDFTMVGDYLLQFPLTWNMGIGEFMMAYQMSTASVVSLIQLHFNEITNYNAIEPESIAQMDGNGFLIPVNVNYADGSRKCLFYRAEFPHLGLMSDEEIDDAIGTMAESQITTEEVERGQEEVSVSKTETQLTDHEVDMTPKESHAGRIILIILIIIFLGGAAAFLLYVRHVHIEREKREARMRKARRIVIANMSKEEDEPFDIDNLDI